jgi:hypothetical protein
LCGWRLLRVMTAWVIRLANGEASTTARSIYWREGEAYQTWSRRECGIPGVRCAMNASQNQGARRPNPARYCSVWSLRDGAVTGLARVVRLLRPVGGIVGGHRAIHSAILLSPAEMTVLTTLAHAAASAFTGVRAAFVADRAVPPASSAVERGSGARVSVLSELGRAEG